MKKSKTKKVSIWDTMDSTNAMFAAAICRDLAEGGDGLKYFGSYGAWNSHQYNAKQFGWLDDNGVLTTLGRTIGEACRDLPVGRAYAVADDYIKTIEKVLINENTIS